MADVLEFWEKEATEKPESTGYQLFFRTIELNEVRYHARGAAKILDCGCGNGYVLRHVQKGNPGAKFWAFDFSPRMIENARKIAGSDVDWAVADFRKTPYPDRSFDYIYSVRALINLESEKDQEDALAELERIIAPGGKIVLVELSQAGFERTNRFLARIGLRKLEHRWHNVFFSPRVEKRMGELFDVQKKYYPVTSLLKYTLESLVTKDTQSTHSEYQRKYDGLTNMVGAFTGLFDRLFSGMVFGRHTTYILKKKNIQKPKQN